MRGISYASLAATYGALINYLTPLPNRFYLHTVFREKKEVMTHYYIYIITRIAIILKQIFINELLFYKDEEKLKE